MYHTQAVGSDLMLSRKWLRHAWRRWPHNPKVAGSNPARATTYLYCWSGTSTARAGMALSPPLFPHVPGQPERRDGAQRAHAGGLVRLGVHDQVPASKGGVKAPPGPRLGRP